MDMEKREIEDIFKDSFEDFEPEVNPSVWKNVQTGLKGAGLGVLAKTILNKIGANAVVAVVSSAIAVVSTVVVMNWTGNSKGAGVAKKTLNPKKITVESPKPVPVEAIKNFLTDYNNTSKAADKTDKKESPIPMLVKESLSATNLNPKDKKKLESVINKYSGEQIASIFPSTVGGPVPLIVNLINNGTGKINKWSFNDGSKSITSTNPIKVFDVPGVYTISLLSTDANGKSAVDSVKIEVTGNSSMSAFSNEFSPDGDGINDVFVFNSKNIVNYSVVIFDKKGNTVYNYTGIDGKWNGTTLKGTKAKEGIYFYILSAIGADGKKYDQSGKIKLIR